MNLQAQQHEAFQFVGLETALSYDEALVSAAKVGIGRSDFLNANEAMIWLLRSVLASTKNDLDELMAEIAVRDDLSQWALVGRPNLPVSYHDFTTRDDGDDLPGIVVAGDDMSTVRVAR